MTDSERTKPANPKWMSFEEYGLSFHQKDFKSEFESAQSIEELGKGLRSYLREIECLHEQVQTLESIQQEKNTSKSDRMLGQEIIPTRQQDLEEEISRMKFWHEQEMGILKENQAKQLRDLTAALKKKEQRIISLEGELENMAAEITISEHKNAKLSEEVATEKARLGTTHFTFSDFLMYSLLNLSTKDEKMLELSKKLAEVSIDYKQNISEFETIKKENDSLKKEFEKQKNEFQDVLKLRTEELRVQKELEVAYDYVVKTGDEVIAENQNLTVQIERLKEQCELQKRSLKFVAQEDARSLDDFQYISKSLSHVVGLLQNISRNCKENSLSTDDGSVDFGKIITENHKLSEENSRLYFEREALNGKIKEIEDERNQYMKKAIDRTNEIEQLICSKEFHDLVLIQHTQAQKQMLREKGADSSNATAPNQNHEAVWTSTHNKMQKWVDLDSQQKCQYETWYYDQIQKTTAECDFPIVYDEEPNQMSNFIQDLAKNESTKLAGEETKISLISNQEITDNKNRKNAKRKGNNDPPKNRKRPKLQKDQVKKDNDSEAQPEKKEPEYDFRDFMTKKNEIAQRLKDRPTKEPKSDVLSTIVICSICFLFIKKDDPRESCSGCPSQIHKRCLSNGKPLCFKCSDQNAVNKSTYEKNVTSNVTIS